MIPGLLTWDAAPEDSKGNNAAEEFVANQLHEEKLYHKYKEYYGYVFYIGKKI